MHPEIFLSPDARAEIVGHIHYYINRGADTAAWRFRGALDRTLERLRQNPGLGEALNDPRPRLAGVRHYRVEGFRRHRVYYRPLGPGIEVLHVLHTSRNRDDLL